MATEQIPTSIIADDAVTGDKIENNPTVAGNLTVSGTTTATGALTASGGIANAGTISAGTLGSNVVFPAGHVVQTVHQTFNQTTTQTSYAEVATHIEKSITITTGNKVFYHFTIPTRLFASGYAYGQFYYILVHKVGSSGTYSAVGTQSGPNNANYYFDQAGNLDTEFYRYFNVSISGIHTPSSGTEQYYRMNVKHIQGNDVTVGLGTSSETLMVLQEIQA